MSNPAGRIFDEAGKEVPDGNFDYARRYGEAVASLAERAIADAEPIELTPFAVATKSVSIPVHNSLYRLARALGVMKREAFLWTGDSQTQGDPMTREMADQETAIESEVACVRLGALNIACIPGELYPELVYGKFQEPVEANADFTDAALEPTVAGIFDERKWMLVGLANDEVGYIIPKRQWDKSPPYAYGKEGGQYGEVNSCSPEVAPIVMEALRQRVAELNESRKVSVDSRSIDSRAAPLSSRRREVSGVRRASPSAGRRSRGSTIRADRTDDRRVRGCRRAIG
jgi:hypothetical protein